MTDVISRFVLTDVLASAVVIATFVNIWHVVANSNIYLLRKMRILGALSLNRNKR